MTHKTRGIVLRSIKYGETSLVVTIFTERFGIQTYMVNGVRSSKKSAAGASCFQPCAILDLVVYHSEQKSMQRIREFSWAVLYSSLLSDVVRNSIAAYMAELMHKCLKQPENHSDLYHFFEESLQQLDKADKTVSANFALFFTLHLPHFFGFRMVDNYSAGNCYLDLQEGCFTPALPDHPHFLDGKLAELSSQLLKVMQPHELEEFRLNQEIRRMLLVRYLEFYTLHIPDFGQLKTLVILQEVL